MIARAGTEFISRFMAMGCPCEILIDTDDEALGAEFSGVAELEARRVEARFSRYVPGNVVDRINTTAGVVSGVDKETGLLLDFAARCHEMSEGLFDVTSGVLRRAWNFKSGAPPTLKDVKALLPLVGWQHVEWNGSRLRLRPGMEIDLGGIAKEYAVDRVAHLIGQRSQVGMLVNFGGDIAVTGQRRDGKGWRIGIENPRKAEKAAGVLHVSEGAVATSGDTKRFVEKGGKRYGHILNPLTGWPVTGAPRSVTVFARTCTEAGFLSTMGMLKGAGAEKFLKDSAERFWCHRG